MRAGGSAGGWHHGLRDAAFHDQQHYDSERRRAAQHEQGDSARRRDPSGHEHHALRHRRYGEDHVFRATSSDFRSTEHASSLAPLRVAALRRDMTSYRQSDPTPQTRYNSSPASRFNSSAEDGNADISERSLHRHDSCPNVWMSNSHDPWTVTHRSRADSDDNFLFERREALSVDNQRTHESPWGSPSSLYSSPDTAVSDPFGGWNRLRIDSPGNTSANSNSPANSPGVRGHDQLDHDTSVAAPNAARSAPTTKKSRYLREMDRRIILSRLAKGEKQAALAKEYGVSRSTVCNLLKQRDIVLARKNENPLSRHPKKARRAAAKSDVPTTAKAPPIPELADRNPRPLSHSACVDDLEEKHQTPLSPAPATLVTEFLSFDDNFVIELETRAISLLKTKLQDRDTSDDDFKRCTSRLMRLVVEEAIGIAAAPVSIFLDQHGSGSEQSRNRSFRAPSFGESTCAVAIEDTGKPLLNIFRLLEPEISTGLIGRSLAAPYGLELHTFSQPNDLRHRHVLLLELVLASGDAACAAIDLMRSRGAQDDQITLIALFVSAEAVALVQYIHPHVRIVSAGIDMQLHRRVGVASEVASPSRVFLERFRSTAW